MNASGTRRFATPLLAASLFAACAGSLGTEPDLDALTITVATTGGIAGMDWEVRLEAAAGRIFVVHCGNHCPWPDPTSRPVPRADVRQIAAVFVAAGVTERAETDYGLCEGCADQFHHVIEYRDADGAHRVEGDGPNFPAELEAVVNRLIWDFDPGQG